MKWYELLDTLAASGHFPNAVHRVLLWSPHPGTGKSGWARFAFPDSEVETCDGDKMADQMRYSVTLRDGNTVTVDGPITRAMRFGRIVTIDEIDKASTDARTMLHAVLDDRRQAFIELNTGEIIRPANGFAVIATTNAHPSKLAPALLDRFDMVLAAHDPNPAIFTDLPDAYADVCKTHYAQIIDESSSQYRWTRPPCVRGMLALAKLSRCIDPAIASEAIFGDGCEIHNLICAASGIEVSE